MLFDLTDPDSVEVVQLFLAKKRSEGQTIGLASGCFDLIHFRHFDFFIRCRRYCDILIVGVDSDELVRKTKGPTRPVIHDSTRALMVNALKPVSFVFVMNGVVDFGRASKFFTPDFVFKNDDFKGREKEILGYEYAKKVVIIEDWEDPDSTTKIIEHVAARNGGTH